MPSDSIHETRMIVETILCVNGSARLVQQTAARVAQSRDLIADRPFPPGLLSIVRAHKAVTTSERLIKAARMRRTALFRTLVLSRRIMERRQTFVRGASENGCAPCFFLWKEEAGSGSGAETDGHVA